MSIRRVLLPLIMSLSVFPAQADIAFFGAALGHVWNTHPEVVQARNTALAAGYDVTGAYAGFLPYAQIDSGLQTKSSTGVARIVLPLFSGGATLAAIDGASAAETQAKADVGRAQLRIGLKLVDAWFNWLASREQDQQWRDYLAQLQTLTGIIERRAEEGVSPPADVTMIISRKRQAEAQAEQNRSVMSSARAQLAALLGTESIGDASWPGSSRQLSDAEADAAWSRASEQHPDILAAMANISRQDAERRVNRGRLSPEVVLRRIEPLGNEPTFSEGRTELALLYQTDSGFRALQSFRGGDNRIEAAKAALDTSRRETQAAIDAAKAERRALALQIGFQQEAAAATAELIESSIRQFKVGRKTWLEVLNVLREANDTRLQLAQQRRAFWAANQRLALQGLYWESLLRETFQEKAP